MAEKMTSNGLVVGLIIEPDEVVETPVATDSGTDAEASTSDKQKRGRKPKAE